MSKLKKASLSLSINAVVILVLAIAMLGLGLGFTKKMFGKFGDTLSIPEPDLTASESDPLVLVADSIDIKYNKATSLPLRYYSGVDGTFTPYLKCPNATIPGASQGVAQAEQKTWRLLIPQGAISDETNVCTIWMDDDSSGTTGTLDSGEGSRQISILVSGTP